MITSAMNTGQLPRFPERMFSSARTGSDDRPTGSASAAGVWAVTRSLRARCRECPETFVGSPAVIACTTSSWVVVARSYTPTFRPSRRTAILVAVSKMSCRLCEMSTTPSPCSARRLTSSSTCSVWATPSAAVGSSRITSREFHITARATATDWRWPPESVATAWRIDLIDVTRRLASVSIVFASIGGSLSRWNTSCASRPRYMFWTTSRLSQRARSWYTTSIPSFAASFGPWIETRSPSKIISPASIGWMPAMHLISVDLPAPLSPTSAITSPFRTSKSTSVSACTEPNDLETPRSSRRSWSLTKGAGRSRRVVSYHRTDGGAPHMGRLRRIGQRPTCSTSRTRRCRCRPSSGIHP